MSEPGTARPGGDDTGADRRRHPRRRLVQEVNCYIDGARLDGWSLDVSAGGLFLKTGVQREVAPGASVGLVFKAQPTSSSPVILFGRVVRQQARADEGLGIAWEKAVTPGESAGLEAVLRQVLGIEPEGIRRIVGEDGQARSVYHFARAMPTAGEPAGFLERPDGVDWPRSVGPGAISRQFDRRHAGASVDEPVRLSGSGRERSGRLRRLGLVGLAITLDKGTALVVGADSKVCLEIRTTAGVVPVALRCRLLGAEPGAVDDATLAFEIMARDEGEHAGIVDRYLKWLHLRSMFEA